jgi:hypothetical protein
MLPILRFLVIEMVEEMLVVLDNMLVDRCNYKSQEEHRLVGFQDLELAEQCQVD